MISKRRLGNTGLEVTQLGYGTMGLRGPRTWGVRVVSEDEAHQFLNLVLDAGINFLDTAPDYGAAEARIGAAISHRRNEFILATKCGCTPTQHADHLEIAHQWTTDVILHNVETSLARMRTDYLDLLQFHGGDARTLEANGLIDQLVKLRDEGTIRHLGISSKLPDLPDLIALGVFETFQVPYSCLAPEHHEVITQAAKSGAGIIIRGGIAQGGPDAEIQRPPLNDVWSAARLDELLTEDMPRAELILRYTLTHPHCDTTIVGTCSAEHLRQNVAAASKGPLPEDLYQEITRRVASSL